MDRIDACATIARIVETDDGAGDECARLLRGEVYDWTIGAIRDLLDWAAEHPGDARAVSEALAR